MLVGRKMTEGVRSGCVGWGWGVGGVCRRMLQWKGGVGGWSIYYEGVGVVLEGGVLRCWCGVAGWCIKVLV